MPFPFDKSIYNRCLILALLLILLITGACGSPKKIIRKNPRSQHFEDHTQKNLGAIRGPLQAARFLRADGDEYDDLLVLKQSAEGAPFLETWLNKEGSRFIQTTRIWQGEPTDRVIEFKVGDFNRDGRHDVIFTGSFSQGRRALLLLNNGHGYFFESEQTAQPSIRPGMTRVEVVDLDRDHNIDLVIWGPDVRDEEGKPSRYPVQFLLNQGGGKFMDRTRLLWPELPGGIGGMTFADYDGDLTLDIFIYYNPGINRLLLNNGLGQLEDVTESKLPPIANEALHADWADFDQDGDQDLIVLTKNIAGRDREYSREYNYALENNGHGYFTKKTLKVLPPFPAQGIYLLDANDDEWADMFLMTSKGTHYMRGAGKWKFSIETKRRLPARAVMHDPTFGDVNDDDFLDILGLNPDHTPRLWVNQF